MATHFECLGFPFTPDGTDDAELVRIIRQLFDEGERLPDEEDGVHAVRWQSEAGVAAHAVISVDNDAGRLQVRCVTPTFLSDERQRVKVFRTLPDDVCRWCDYLHGEIALEGQSKGNPFFTEIKDPGFDRERDWRGADLEMQIALLALEVRAFAGRADFEVNRPEDVEMRSFVPTGLLDADHPRPNATVTGEVVDAERRTNSVSGLDFIHVRLDTLGGTFDLAAAIADLPEPPAAGSVLWAQCALIARITGEAV